MANTKITGLTAIAALATADLVEVVDDPAGTPLSRKATVQQVLDSLGTTKGDLYVYDGTALLRVGVGTDDQVLTADAAAASGVKWAAGGGGGGGGWTEIEEVVLAADGRIEFSGIPQTYTHLAIYAEINKTTAAVNNSKLLLRMGASTVDTGSNYYGGYHGTAYTNTVTLDTSAIIGLTKGGNSDGSTMDGWLIEIPLYRVLRPRNIFARGYLPDATNVSIYDGRGRWTNTTDTIDIIQVDAESFSSELKSGSRAVLYGY